MKPANKGVRSFQRYSPTYVAARLTPEQVRFKDICVFGIWGLCI